MSKNWYATMEMRCEKCYHVVEEDWYWVKNGKLQDIVYYCMCEGEEE